MSRIVFIGCGKAKLEGEHEARELYIGSLFCSRRIYAESTGDPWFIISARYGLLHPSRVIRNYDVSIEDLTPLNRAAWYVGVVSQLLTELDDSCFLDDQMLRNAAVEIHAGAAYAERLIDALRAVGFSAASPVLGLTQGQQMRFYAQHRISLKRRESCAV